MGRFSGAGGATFRVEGIAPLELRQYPESVQRMYWKWVVELTITAKDRELAAGLDRFGAPMVPISLKTRLHRKSVKGPADPYAPPLQPAHGLSRTRSLFSGRAFPDHAEFFWLFDEFTGASWGKILKLHARGAGHLPVRDVIGISPESLGWVRAHALSRWMGWMQEHPPRPIVPPTPKPVKIPPTAVRAAKPPKIAVEPGAITDLLDFTFGIGAIRKEVERMLGAGYFTGFRQLHENQ